MKKTIQLNSLMQKVLMLFAMSTLLSFTVFGQEQDQGDLLATMPDELTNVGTGVPISYQPYELAKFTKDMNRYPAAAPPKGSFNKHGELEFLGENVLVSIGSWR
nr:hypothetical protein [uncultured Allomuricauda sp.]